MTRDVENILFTSFIGLVIFGALFISLRIGRLELPS